MHTELKCVLVGCGKISDAWRRGAADLEGLTMAGFVDLDLEAARNSAVAWNAPATPVSDDLAAILRRVRPDVVFNCTVPEAHHDVTLTALAHGAHVLGEKPLANNMEEARRMVEAAEAAGRLFAVIQNRRYNSNIRRLRAFLASGALGQLTTVNSDFYIGVHFGGFRDSMPHVLLADMAIHTFDAARYLTATEAQSVFCHEWNPACSWYEGDASAVAVFQMSGGIVYTYRGSWCSEGLHTSWECDWRIVGTRGSVTWDGETGFRAQVTAGDEGFMRPLTDVALPEIAVPPEQTGSHGGLIRDFLRAVREGGSVETVASDNIHSLAMVHAAIDSAARKMPVDVHA
ncbi:MAG: Gfo/Idh/MocA family oxidoreductase [Anaerolineaceae bacterium]|nr:Gfo/Idh/MocA family oxidoreductase [Anaerolineaceae bacterium]MCY4023964.1 Gfo/Idh/MocA family oxidoreductase [Anaerolineaceae bacterium]